VKIHSFSFATIGLACDIEWASAELIVRTALSSTAAVDNAGEVFFIWASGFVHLLGPKFLSRKIMFLPETKFCP
jgi:hypothetical protein